MVILAEQGAQDGVIDDAVLMLRDTLATDRVTVSDPAGHRLCVTVPLSCLDAEPYTVVVGLDLTVEPTK